MKATDLNISVLADAANGSILFPNRFDATSIPHVRRCLKAGFVEVDGSCLKVTPAGVAAIVAYNAKHARGYLKPLPVPA